MNSNDRYQKWRHFFLAFASLLVASGCSVRIGETGDRRPGTLYVFNVDPADSEILVYRLVEKPRTFEQSWKEAFGESNYASERIASVNAQRYLQISVPTGSQNYAMTSAKAAAAPTTPQLMFNPDGQTFYAKVHTLTSSEIAAKAVSEIVVTGTANWFLRQSNWPHIYAQPPTGAQVDPVSADEAQELLKQMTPQEAAQKEGGRAPWAPSPPKPDTATTQKPRTPQ